MGELLLTLSSGRNCLISPNSMACGSPKPFQRAVWKQPMCVKSLWRTSPCANSLNPDNSPVHWEVLLSHFADKETEYSGCFQG